MSDISRPAPRQDSQFLRRIHTSTKMNLRDWLDAPAHIHHMAYRMANPRVDRPQSQKEFQQLLQCLEIPKENAEILEKFGYGLKASPNGDRLIVIWEAHTEYYSYQVWHIPHDEAKPLEFGPISFPNYAFPFSPLGMRVNALDLVVSREAQILPEQIRQMMPGPDIYGSRVFGEEITVATSFFPDEHQRERYLIYSSSMEALLHHLLRVTDSVIAIENYYHLVLLPFQAFSRSVDQIRDYEQRHLYQRAVILDRFSDSTHETFKTWLTTISQDFLQVSRSSESMRHRLSASIAYDSVVHGYLRALQEQPVARLPPLSESVNRRLMGVADGYQQLLQRMDAIQHDFEVTIAVIRTRIELLLQEQSLGLQNQNIELLASVDRTTRGQAILQQTVESVSVIVITYYMVGLGSYVFTALRELGWLAKTTYAAALFVPVALGISFALMTFSRKIIEKRMSSVQK